MGDLPGMDVRLLRMMDANSVAGMLSNNCELLVYLQLALEEADILRRKGRHRLQGKGCGIVPKDHVVGGALLGAEMNKDYR